MSSSNNFMGPKYGFLELLFGPNQGMPKRIVKQTDVCSFHHFSHAVQESKKVTSCMTLAAVISSIGRVIESPEYAFIFRKQVQLKNVKSSTKFWFKSILFYVDHIKPT